MADTSRQTATVAVRILSGEKPSEIRTPPVQFSRPGLTGGKCSAGESGKKTCRRVAKSCFVIRRYGNNIVAHLAHRRNSVEAAMIIGLLYEHWRRQRAEILARNTMSELSHVNRRQRQANYRHRLRMRSINLWQALWQTPKCTSLAGKGQRRRGTRRVKENCK